MQKPLKILQASAGSGKTFSLAAHYLSLLFSGENKYREILAVTFTNKATEEMKARILDVLRGLAEGDENVDAYRNSILKTHPQLAGKALKEQADKIYRKILHDYSRFAVSTIDGFVQKVIRGFAFELGLSADYALEMNYDKVKDELVQKMDTSLDNNRQLLEWIIALALERIGDNKNWDYKSELGNLISEIFKESFDVFEKAIAAIGAGNIDALFKQYNKATKQEIDAYEKELAEYGKQAAAVFERYNLDKSHFVNGSKNWLWKLQAFIHNDAEKFPKIFTLVDNPGAWFKPGKGDDALYHELNALLKQIQAFYGERVGAYQLAIAFKKNLYYLRLMQEVVTLLSAYRNEHDNLLISDAQKLITGITGDAGDNPSFIWEKVGARYRNFLFDEFQDTSVNQWKSFRALLANTLAAAEGKYIDNLIVGDTKQSIYRWRNGDWNILHRQAKNEIGEHYVLEESLAENYRSTANIIDFNNRLYQLLPALMQSYLNNAVQEQPPAIHEWWNSNGFNQVITSVYAGAAQARSPFTKPGGTIKVKRLSKAENETARYTETAFRGQALNDAIHEIKALIHEKNYARRDIAILVRSNFEATACVEKLMEQGIPVISGDALLIGNNLAVDLIINTLKVITGIDEQTALYKANCIALYHAVHKKQAAPSLYCDLDEKSLSQLDYVLPASLCAHWQQWLQLPLAELVENLITGYQLDHLQQHIPYLLSFRDLIGNATKPGEKGIGAFLEWWEEEGCAASLPSPESADAVQVITVHKSKGLAFRAVFVPFCIWDNETKANTVFWVPAQDTLYHELGNIPLRFGKALARTSVAKAYFKEVLYSNMDSLNMLYVATTRAKDFLYLATMFKKEADKLTTIGDVVNAAMQQFNPAFATDNLYEKAEDILIASRPAERSCITLKNYPTSQRLSDLYAATEDRHTVHLLNMEKSGRKGSLAHEVLANASNEEETDNYIEKLLEEGVIQEEERAPLKQSVTDVLQHPELSKLLHQPGHSIIERNIIDVNGRTQRPDRILIKDDSVLLLDYKFTLEQSDKHVEQILKYKELLKQMGYANVQSYLFYAVRKELKMVG
ncbi:UvrD-helicase domain-containing protein [Parafilimonas sp.]|uniref:UvrD-helicase domain-containing protein n=1 Tax=Parafilimonas sp. TaxID=1969739 RepID=UPI0039E71DD6